MLKIKPCDIKLPIIVETSSRITWTSTAASNYFIPFQEHPHKAAFWWNDTSACFNSAEFWPQVALSRTFPCSTANSNMEMKRHSIKKSSRCDILLRNHSSVFSYCFVCVCMCAWLRGWAVSHVRTSCAQVLKYSTRGAFPTTFLCNPIW